MMIFKLLLVDDHFQDVILFRSVLKKVASRLPFPIICDEIDSGLDALHLIAAAHYDMVFLDQQMPDPDGLACFEGICQLPWSSEKKRPAIIAYSNCDLREFRARCLHAGMDEFFVKYLNEKELLALVEKYMPERISP